MRTEGRFHSSWSLLHGWSRVKPQNDMRKPIMKLKPTDIKVKTEAI